MKFARVKLKLSRLTASRVTIIWTEIFWNLIIFQIIFSVSGKHLKHKPNYQLVQVFTRIPNFKYDRNGKNRDEKISKKNSREW